MKISAEQEKLLAALKEFINPCRKLTIALDGITGVGKSTLGRYLAWKLEMPLVETDMFRIMEEEPPAYYYDEIAKILQSRHDLNRPVIVEGVFVLHTLGKVDVVPDYMAYVENTESDEGLRYKIPLNRYNADYAPKGKANYVLNTNFINYI